MLSFEGPVETVDVESDAASARYARILCPECGAWTKARADGSVLCGACVGVEWQAPLQRHMERYPLSLTRCPECSRVLVSEASAQNKRWEGGMEHESEALLGLLLRKAKHALLGKRATASVEGLSRALDGGRLSLEDARLVYTEPHSLRVKVEAVVRHDPSSEAPATLHRCELIFVEHRQLCGVCAGERSGKGRKMGGGGKEEFGAKVQVRVRRRDGGKAGERTLRSLEDGLKSTSASTTATAARRVSRRHNGFDVDFANRNDAQRFLSELKRLGRAPLKFAEETKKLVTHDANSNTSEWQRTALLFVPAVDKHDVLLSETGDLCLCLGVRANLRLVDLTTKREFNLSADAFFHHPLNAVLSTDDLVQFRVIDPNGAARVSNADSFGPPRRFFAPFKPKIDTTYLGYDLEAIAHRVKLPTATPTVVVVIPAPITSCLNLNLNQNHPPASSGSPKVAAPLSRKQRRQSKRKQRRQSNQDADCAVQDDDRYHNDLHHHVAAGATSFQHGAGSPSSSSLSTPVPQKQTPVDASLSKPAQVKEDDPDHASAGLFSALNLSDDDDDHHHHDDA